MSTVNDEEEYVVECPKCATKNTITITRIFDLKTREVDEFMSHKQKCSGCKRIIKYADLDH